MKRIRRVINHAVSRIPHRHFKSINRARAVDDCQRVERVVVCECRLDAGRAGSMHKGADRNRAEHIVELRAAQREHLRRALAHIPRYRDAALQFILVIAQPRYRPRRDNGVVLREAAPFRVAAEGDNLAHCQSRRLRGVIGVVDQAVLGGARYQSRARRYQLKNLNPVVGVAAQTLKIAQSHARNIVAQRQVVKHAQAVFAVQCRIAGAVNRRRHFNDIVGDRHAVAVVVRTQSHRNPPHIRAAQSHKPPRMQNPLREIVKAVLMRRQSQRNQPGIAAIGQHRQHLLRREDRRKRQGSRAHGKRRKVGVREYVRVAHDIPHRDIAAQNAQSHPSRKQLRARIMNAAALQTHHRRHRILRNQGAPAGTRRAE